MDKKNINLVTAIAVIGGFIFGLNMAGISGGVESIKDAFSLTDNGIGLVVSSLTIGCLLGAMFTGNFADRYGRKKVFLAIALLFVISSVGCALASNQWALMAFRLMAGLAVGADSVVGPMYISEMAPAERRGKLVTYQQFLITIGILVAYVIDYFLLDLSQSWRYMLAVPAVFGVVFFILVLLLLPESERWEHNIAAGKSANPAPRVKFGGLFKGRIGHVVLIGTALAALQQITGINAVINYAPTIFQQTGVGGGTALLQSCIVGVVNVLSTIVAIRLIDTKGRKTLLIGGAIGMIVSLFYLMLSFIFSWSPVGVLVALLVYIAFFGASFSPVMWVVNNEIFPDSVRAQAVSFATAVSWVCTFIVVQFSPSILNSLGGAWLFGIFGVFSVIALFFVIFRIPETKGKTFEQIQKELGL
mgnify:CR=1 FL=1|jgi:Arabinose efflux permease